MLFFKKPDRETVEKLKAKKDVRGLIKILNTNLENIVGRAAADALGEIGDPLAVEPLINALKSTSNDVRSLSASSLRKIGDARAIPALKIAAKDGNSQVKYHATEALRDFFKKGLINEETLRETEYYVSSVDFTGRTVRDSGHYMPAKHANCTNEFRRVHLNKGNLFPACPNCRRPVSFQLLTYDSASTGSESDN